MLLTFIAIFSTGFVLVTGDGCRRATDWKFEAPNGKELEVFGIKYQDKGRNNAAFTVYVHGSYGKKTCVHVKAGQLAPTSGWITVDCNGGGMDAKSVTLKSNGLRVCGDEITLIGRYKTKPAPKPELKCPAHSRRQGNRCIPDGCAVTGGIRAIAVDVHSAKQSDVAHGGIAIRAVDHIRSGHWGHRGCTHTYGHTQVPWWSVRFRRRSQVKYVEIQNRIDCCSNRLKNFYIMVDNQRCTYHSGSFYGRKRIYCDHPVCGSILTIKLSKKEPLTLCDVQAYGPSGSTHNPACRAPAGNVVIPLDPDTARQSDIAYGGEAWRAVDGNRGGYWNTNTCTHTHAGRQAPWWSIQLRGKALVRAVEIQNRQDCCGFRLTNFYIMVDDKRCKYHSGSFKSRKRITCDKPVCGRTLSIKLSHNRHPLTLCDVQVLGRPLWPHANQCRGSGSIIPIPANAGTARQSDTVHGGVASRAVDGIRSGHWTHNGCTHTNAGRQVPWWSVHFSHKAVVNFVEIQNRLDCCPSRLANIHILVDDQRCTFHGGWFHGRKRIYCDHPVCGSKLTIKLSTKSQLLTLCDVQIFGQRISAPAPQCHRHGGASVIPVNAHSARQSFIAHGGVPIRAVDGNRGGHWVHGSCTHTLANYQIPWWSVEFRHRSLVQAVEIQNRVDCCAFRLTNFYIMVDDKLCKYHHGWFNGRKRINCDRPVCGNRITIRLSTRSQPLTLCDVRVIGWQQHH